MLALIESSWMNEMGSVGADINRLGWIWTFAVGKGGWVMHGVFTAV